MQVSGTQRPKTKDAKTPRVVPCSSNRLAKLAGARIWRTASALGMLALRRGLTLRASCVVPVLVCSSTFTMTSGCLCGRRRTLPPEKALVKVGAARGGTAPHARPLGCRKQRTSTRAAVA
eukprot:scaffold2668_cov319-Prasinococcus_capsulatus_cf.AAC.4